MGQHVPGTPVAYPDTVEAIPLADLEALHAPLRQELAAAAARVLASNRFILGPEVEAFESELGRALGVRHAVGVSSGTDALLALLMALGVGPGDEVITTPYSFFATVEGIVRLGARPIFVDVDPLTLNIDPDRAIERLGPRTRAVLLVHLYGRMAGSAALEAACARAGTALLEDAAQAVGSSRIDGGARRGVGTLGAGAALSFFPAKNLGGFGDGGMVLTEDAEVAQRVRSLRNHGVAEKHQHRCIGGNFRLDELQAALLRVKLPHLADWTAARLRLAGTYRERLADLPLRLPPPDEGCVWNQFVVGVPDGRRDALAASLEGEGIASAVYYPVPLHLQPALAGKEVGAPGDFPVAERAARESLALPIHPALTDAQLSRVTTAVRRFFG
jgi:dTDP-4-amino-4,6-dideoxygalactose transaminase